MDVMPPSLTPGDGRSAPQGTDLPRAVGEKRRQRHFGILWRTAQSRQLGCVFSPYRKLREKSCSEHRAASFCKAVRKWERARPAFSYAFRQLSEAKQKPTRYAGGDKALYKNHPTKYNRGVQPLLSKGKVILWQTQITNLHIRSGCANTISCSPLSIDEK